MSQTEDTAPIDRQSVEQTVGIFPTDAALQNAVGRLSTAGYSRDRLVTPAFATQAALTDAAKTEEDTRQLRTLRSSTTAAAASMAGAATVVATGGAAAAALAVAAGAGLVAGAGVFAAQNAADAVTSATREAHACEGALRLIVALADPSERSVVEQAMRDAGAFSVTTSRHVKAAFAHEARTR